MNTELKNKLRKLELGDFVEAIEEEENDISLASKSFDERIDYLCEWLTNYRYNKLVQKLITNAYLRFPEADVSSLNYEIRAINKDTIINLSNMKFVETNTNILIIGPTGSGKTYLACALGKEACKHTYRVFYIRMQNLTRRVEDLINNSTETNKFLKRLANYHVLIIDEWLTYKVSDKTLRFLYELFELRSDKHPTIFVTQFDSGEWHERLLGGQHADSIMDRIMHNSFSIEKTDANLRKYYGEQQVNKLKK